MKKPTSNLKEISDRIFSLYGQEDLNFQVDRYEKNFISFKNEFNENNAYFASSSGRVEICGNHTDHNGGLVLATTISLDIIASFLPTSDGTITVKSQGFEDVNVNLDDCKRFDNCKKGTSKSLVIGILNEFAKNGYKVGGFKANLTSNIPKGAGVSSSAAYELLIVEILNFLYNDGKIDNLTKTKIACQTEREYFGKPCGLLDQAVIAYGGLSLLDFSTLGKVNVKKVNVDLQDLALVLVDTGESHENLTEHYASIPKEMKLVANSFNCERLIEVNESEFYKNRYELIDSFGDRAVSRSEHFFEENSRVKLLVNALKNNDVDLFLEQIKLSGLSSKNKLKNCSIDDRESVVINTICTCKKYLPSNAVRVHGGGFAGTVLSVLKIQELDGFLENIYKVFSKNSVYVLKVRDCGVIVL